MNKTHVALTFNDGFWAPAYTVMRSAALSTAAPQELHFHLCHDGLTGGHRADLDSISRELGPVLSFYDIREQEGLVALSQRAPTRRKWPPIIYARLFLHQILPAEIERIVYLDCDVMVRRPLEWLRDLDLRGNPVAAVSDPGRLRRANGRDMRETLRPFFHAARYFNSGVLVIDRAGLARADLPGLLRSHIEAGTMQTLYYDQDVLNLAFRDRWLELDWRWNLTKPMPSLRALDPYIVHYTTENKPWNTFNFVAFSATYRDLMTDDLFRRFRRYRLRQRLHRWLPAVLPEPERPGVT